jgi:hypothetical protein
LSQKQNAPKGRTIEAEVFIESIEVLGEKNTNEDERNWIIVSCVTSFKAPGREIG